MQNTLYYGDNLEILREYIKDESIDLIYLDPPFNSNQSYNILFAEKNGTQSHAQIKAFEDTWHWDTIKAEETYREIVEKLPTKISSLIQAFRSFLGSNDMMAYLVMMAIRLYELHRVLKQTGSIYLHCDPTASHYLKLVLDSIFGAKNIQNEIIWVYKSGGATKRRFGRKHDVIFFYSKNSDKYIFNPQKEKSYMMHEYGFTKSEFHKDEKGQYTWVIMKDWWEIPSIGSADKQRLGYPTQKPEALLERIIKASSNEGDLVLDPFCGCGTTITVAEKLERKWIGIDITHLAISLMKHRLKDTFGDGIEYKVIGEPVDSAGAEELAHEDPYQFQWWALGLVGARPCESEKKRGADRGIDGIIKFHDDTYMKETKQIILQVKCGHVNRGMIDALKGVVEREKAEIGVLITLENPTKPMKLEAISSGFYEAPSGKKYPKIQILTIEDILYNGKNIERPPKVAANDVTFKRAKKYTKSGEQGELL
jgi:site-specific DNA-methyltransferase (adenine-specific)